MDVFEKNLSGGSLDILDTTVDCICKIVEDLRVNSENLKDFEG
jgi:hypothetical protein